MTYRYLHIASFNKHHDERTVSVRTWWMTRASKMKWINGSVEAFVVVNVTGGLVPGAGWVTLLKSSEPRRTSHALWPLQNTLCGVGRVAWWVSEVQKESMRWWKWVRRELWTTSGWGSSGIKRHSAVGGASSSIGQLVPFLQVNENYAHIHDPDQTSRNSVLRELDSASQSLVRASVRLPVTKFFALDKIWETSVVREAGFLEHSPAVLRPIVEEWPVWKTVSMQFFFVFNFN